MLEEIRDKGLTDHLLIVAARSSARIRSLTEHVIDLQAPPDLPDKVRPPVDVIVGQLVALFLAIENGVRPDTPSTGAISRVVSHVKIYAPAATGRGGREEPADSAIRLAYSRVRAGFLSKYISISSRDFPRVSGSQNVAVR